MTTGRVIIVDREDKEKHWWQTCSVAEFEAKTGRLEWDALVSLADSLKVAVGRCGNTSSTPSEDPAKRLRARHALVWFQEKLAIVKRRLREIQGSGADVGKLKHAARLSEHDAKLMLARSIYENGDTHGAVGAILDLLERK